MDKFNINPINSSQIKIRTSAFVASADYNELRNLPSLGGITIQGDMAYADLLLSKTNINTTTYWENQSITPELGEIVIYTDRNVINNVAYPGVKIGNGNTPLNNLPFIGDDISSQILTQVLNKIDLSEKGVANGVATLDEEGKIPFSQLPSYIDDTAGAGVTNRAWSANKLTTEFAEKEDAPYVVTFTITPDQSGDSAEVECDRTLNEIGAAYNVGKRIKAIANVLEPGNDSMRYPSELNTVYVESQALPGGGPTYTLAVFGGRVIDVNSEGFIDIELLGASIIPSWRLTYIPVSLEVINDNGGAGDTTSTWSADKLTTEFSSVNTSLAEKEDKPDLIATYTITGNNTATCDKTIEEIGQAYDSGKNIEAIIVGDGQRFKAQIFGLRQRGTYIFFVSTTVTIEGIIYIVLAHSSGSETIPVMQTEPMLSMNGVYTAQNMKIAQLANPTASTDAANKGYVDTALATKEDKPGLTVTFTLVSRSGVVPPGEPIYTVVCDTTDSDIVTAHDNGVKIKAVAVLNDVQSELPISVIENIPNVGQFIAFMGSAFDPVRSGGLSTLMLSKLPWAQDWQINIYGISDVQINGTSIVNEIGVANIPLAGLNQIGVVSAGNNSSTTTGIYRNGTYNMLYIAPATSSDIKTPASNNKRPIVPNTQHEAAFYGLAKAAGDATQSASSNAVGTYTDEAKSAIQSMLGVTRIDDTAGAGDTDVTFSADKLTDMNSSLLNQINGKQDAPETAGTAGQVLSLDSNLDPVWSTPSGGGGVSDVKVNNVSVVSQGVANVPVAGTSVLGVAKIDATKGVNIDANGNLKVEGSTVNQIKQGTNSLCPIMPAYLTYALYYGLSKLAGEDLKNDTVTVGTYPEKSLSAISSMLNAPVSVSGTTPSITAKAGVRYVCGEVSTLTIVVPSSGCIDVTFESGSTATVLTVTPPTGMTMRWANGFDPSSLDANTTYEINIMDGCLGVAGSWT